MSRYSPEVDRDVPEVLGARPSEASPRGSSAGQFGAELAALIDQATEGKPTISEFLERLDARGVVAISRHLDGYLVLIGNLLD